MSRTWFLQRGLALMLALPLLLAACDGKVSTMTLPDPPAPFTRPGEYAFGDDVAVADERLAQRAGAALGNHAQRPREVHYVAPAGTDFDKLRQFYAAQAREGGWPRRGRWRRRCGRGRGASALLAGTRRLRWCG